ncbi:hypothetical protein AB4043_23050 [Terriglobus sp. YAF25]|uniref:hypothetical protein n=1 Tax=Terriglobus sp. YAF25 TaxID=3233080 RepID=UPI003F9D6E3E
MQAVSGKRWALTLVSGVLQVLIFPMAGPVPAWRAVLCWLALIPLLVALLEAKPLRTREFALLGYACGILWYLGSCYWVMPTMYLYGGMSKPAGFGILLLFALYLGLYHALFAILIGLLRRFWSAGYVLLASPFVWVAVELARARVIAAAARECAEHSSSNYCLARIACALYDQRSSVPPDNRRDDEDRR